MMITNIIYYINLCNKQENLTLSIILIVRITSLKKNLTITTTQY